MTGDTGRNGFLLNRSRGGETVAGDTLLQVGVQGGENRTGCRLSLSLCHDCVGCSFGDAAVSGSGMVFDIVSSGSAVIAVGVIVVFVFSGMLSLG